MSNIDTIDSALERIKEKIKESRKGMRPLSRGIAKAEARVNELASLRKKLQEQKRHLEQVNKMLENARARLQAALSIRSIRLNVRKESRQSWPSWLRWLPRIFPSDDLAKERDQLRAEIRGQISGATDQFADAGRRASQLQSLVVDGAQPDAQDALSQFNWQLSAEERADQALRQAAQRLHMLSQFIASASGDSNAALEFFSEYIDGLDKGIVEVLRDNTQALTGVASALTAKSSLNAYMALVNQIPEAMPEQIIKAVIAQLILKAIGESDDLKLSAEDLMQISSRLGIIQRPYRYGDIAGLKRQETSPLIGCFGSDGNASFATLFLSRGTRLWLRKRYFAVLVDNEGNRQLVESRELATRGLQYVLSPEPIYDWDSATDAETAGFTAETPAAISGDNILRYGYRHRQRITWTAKAALRSMRLSRSQASLYFGLDAAGAALVATASEWSKRSRGLERVNMKKTALSSLFQNGLSSAFLPWLAKSRPLFGMRMDVVSVVSIALYKLWGDFQGYRKGELPAFAMLIRLGFIALAVLFLWEFLGPYAMLVAMLLADITIGLFKKATMTEFGRENSHAFQNLPGIRKALSFWAGSSRGFRVIITLFALGVALGLLDLGLIKFAGMTLGQAVFSRLDMLKSLVMPNAPNIASHTTGVLAWGPILQILLGLAIGFLWGISFHESGHALANCLLGDNSVRHRINF
jgi:hypothetical protein